MTLIGRFIGIDFKNSHVVGAFFLRYGIQYQYARFLPHRDFDLLFQISIVLFQPFRIDYDA